MESSESRSYDTNTYLTYEEMILPKAWNIVLPYWET